ncbi:MAG TPA: LacI family DNA-binding transcriptional regulator [Microlunatus sp.]|nr:LacI family DNA-binding transcriptional regulator [Microlunatus sp.]
MSAPPPAAVRLSEVAEAAGVSIATASRSLRGLGGVSDTVAEKVRGIAEELGYVTNSYARTLAGGRTTIVGLILNQIDDPYFTEIAAGVVRAAEEADLTVQIGHSARDPQLELKQIRSLVAQRARAIIIAGSGYTDPQREAQAKDLLARYQAGGGRAAVIGRHFLGVDAVQPDNKGAAGLVAQHLVELGHRDVLIISGLPSLTTVEDRQGEALKVLTASGTRGIVVETDFTGHDAGQAAIDALEAHPEATAVMALSDAMAIAVLTGLRRAGVEVPRSVSVTGVDDVPVAELISPSLTTAAFPLADLGREALLLTTRPPATRPRRKLIPATLAVRESTAPPRD